MNDKALSQEPMRDATPEEQKSVNDYIKSISTPTGVKFDDAISREDATAEFIKWQTEVAYAFGRDYLGVRIIQSAIDTIRELPSVTQKSGKWIKEYEDGVWWKCSECNSLNCCKGNYCPDCGARMESEDKE